MGFHTLILGHLAVLATPALVIFLVFCLHGEESALYEQLPGAGKFNTPKLLHLEVA